MDERKQKYTEPWDDGVYGIGNTQPPKNHGGIIALLLIIVIFLSGIVSALGIMNVQLFKELEQLNQVTDSVPMSFSDTPDAETIQSPTEPTEDLVAIHAGDGVSILLRPSPESVENIPQEGGLSWQEIYEKNIPAVVSITTETTRERLSGTGVIISELGYIVTNCHVVGEDPVSDLAVLHIEATGLTAAEFGDSAAMRVGDAVAAIGDPLGTGLRGTMTDGIVSAINRDVKLKGRTMTLIQTNAALNTGNSGGPLVNCYGQVIGINTMKIGTFTDNAGVEGLGFAIPSATVKEIVDQLIAQGYVSGRPTLGLEGESLSSFYQHYYRMPAGLYITAVDRSSDAHHKGVETGDILLYIGQQRITSPEEMKAAVMQYAVGDTVDTIIYRSGQQYQVELTLTEDKG